MLLRRMSCYHSPGGLVGRLLPRMLLKERGISPRAMQFSKTEAGKPYIASPQFQSSIHALTIFDIANEARQPRGLTRLLGTTSHMTAD